MNHLVSNYCDDMEQKFGDEWTEYLPIFYSEQRELLERWGFNTESLVDESVGEMFSNVLIHELDGTNYSHKTIELKGLTSTCSVMEWILMNGCPDLYCTHFNFPDDTIKFGMFSGLPRSLVVSSIPKSEVFTHTPVEEWHEPIKGMRRIMVMDGMWYAEISGRYYYITI